MGDLSFAEYFGNVRTAAGAGPGGFLIVRNILATLNKGGAGGVADFCEPLSKVINGVGAVLRLFSFCEIKRNEWPLSTCPLLAGRKRGKARKGKERRRRRGYPWLWSAWIYVRT